MNETVLLVTGASTGIGAALVELGRTQGAYTIGVCRRNSAANETWQADLSVASEAEAVASQWCSRLGSESWKKVIVVANAGTVQPIGKVETWLPAAIASSLQLNLVAPAVLAAATVKAVAGSHRRTTFVAVSTGLARRCMVGLGGYTMGKAGLEKLVEQLALEYPEITSVGLSPGMVDTPMQALLRSEGHPGFAEASFFQQAYASGALKDPRVVAGHFLSSCLAGELQSGKIYRHDSGGISPLA